MNLLEQQRARFEREDEERRAVREQQAERDLRWRREDVAADRAFFVGGSAIIATGALIILASALIQFVVALAIRAWR